MSEMKVYSFLLPFALILSLMLYSCDTYGKVQESAPIIWDLSNLDYIKNDDSYQKLYNKIIRIANDYCERKPVVVTNKENTFAPNKHYYCSIGTYWWPDTNNPGKYVIKDGIPNPEHNLYDRKNLSIMSDCCKYLSIAFYLTGDLRYYEAYIRQLKAWFIDSDTFMYPTFEYAQVAPGMIIHKGTSTGFIGAYPFNSIIESIRLVNSVKRIDTVTMKQLKKWFLAFARWADYGIFSEKLRHGKNNIGLAYDVTLVNMYLFAGKERRAKKISAHFEENRLKIQILPDGSQPAELTRTNAFTYSLFNLHHIIDFCYLMRYWDLNYYSRNSQLIDSAFSFLYQYVGHEDSFPYKQISDWSVCEDELRQLSLRRDKLIGKHSPDSLKILYMDTIDQILQ